VHGDLGPSQPVEATLLLNEPRRIGKTSFLVRLCHAPPPPWICIRQSFQGVSTTVGLAELALNEIQSHQKLSQRARGKARAPVAQRAQGGSCPRRGRRSPHCRRAG